jgi:hypothetical protein
MIDRDDITGRDYRERPGFFGRFAVLFIIPLE